MKEAVVLIVGPDFARKQDCARIMESSGLPFVFVCDHGHKTGFQKDSPYPLYYFNGESVLGFNHALMELSTRYSWGGTWLFHYTPPSEIGVFHEYNLNDIQRYSDVNLVKWVQIIRTIITNGITQPSARIAFSLLGDVDDQLTPLQSMALEGLANTITALFSHYRNETIDMRGIRLPLGKDEQAFSILVEQLTDAKDKNSGKWLSQSKPGLVGKIFGRER